MKKINTIKLLLLFSIFFSLSSNAQKNSKDSITQIEVYGIPFLTYEEYGPFTSYDVKKKSRDDSCFVIFSDNTAVSFLTNSKRKHLRNTIFKKQQDYINSRIAIRYIYLNGKQEDYFINGIGRKSINFMGKHKIYKLKYDMQLITDIISITKNEKLKKILLDQEAFLNKK